MRIRTSLAYIIPFVMYGCIFSHTQPTELIITILTSHVIAPTILFYRRSALRTWLDNKLLACLFKFHIHCLFTTLPFVPNLTAIETHLLWTIVTCYFLWIFAAFNVRLTICCRTPPTLGSFDSKVFLLINLYLSKSY